MLMVAISTLTAAVAAAMVEASTMSLVRRRTLPGGRKQNERNEMKMTMTMIEISMMSLNQAIPTEMMEFNSNNIDTIAVGTIDETSSYPTLSPRLTETVDMMSMPKLVDQYDNMPIAVDENSMSMTLFDTKAISESMFFLPTSISCLLGGSDVAICCPNFISKTPATDNDGVCSLLGCLNLGGDDDKFLNDGCTCTDIASACDSVALLSSMVSNLPEACESATMCCLKGTSNDDWDTCMSTVQVPDFSSYLPEMTGAPVSSPTNAIELSMPLTQSDMAITLDETSMSMPPIGFGEMSMSMGTNLIGVLSIPKLEQYDMSIAVDENNMSMTLFETKAISESMFFLPTSISCLLGGSDVAICCPNFISKTPAADNDGVCSLLGCLNLGGDDEKLKINDECTCTDIASACDSVELLSSMVSNLPEACESATTCCLTGTSNDDWDTCMSTVQVPDFSSYLPDNPNHKKGTEAPVSSPTIMSMPLTQSDITITLDKTSMSMPPIVLVEMSMSMGLISFPTSREPTSSPWPSINDKVTVPPSSLPTKSPSKSPVQSFMTAPPTTSSPVSESDVESLDLNAFVTKTQLQLTGVYSEMDDTAVNIFKQSCVSFLNDFLLDAQTNIRDIKCAIYNQQVLSGRRLGRGEISTLINGRRMLVPRVLKGESSLLVDVIFDGIATSNDTDSSFTNQVTDTFVTHSTEFTRELQDNGKDAGIDSFDDLTSTSVNSPSGEVSEIVDDTSDGPDDNTSKKGWYLAIATIALSGLVMVVLFTLVLHRIRKRSDESIDESVEPYLSELIIDEEYESDRLNSLRDQPQRSTSIRTLDLSPRGNLTPMNASPTGLSYKYSLDEGLASPESIVSPLSATGQKVIDWINCKEFTQVNRTKYHIMAPPGKLGIIIDTCPEGPVVHSIKDNSPLVGLIFTGDLIVAIDDEDTTGWSAHYLTRLVAQKSKATRKITVLRSAN
jgi:hypothetical protein